MEGSQCVFSTSLVLGRNSCLTGTAAWLEGGGEHEWTLPLHPEEAEMLLGKGLTGLFLLDREAIRDQTVREPFISAG